MINPIPTTLTYRTSTVISNVERVESAKNALFVGDFGLRTESGVDLLTTCAVFWVELPERAEFSHYFALYRSPTFGNNLAVTDGQCSVNVVITGVCLPSGEVIFSRHRHHNCEAITADVSIDGGREYMRLSYGADIDMSQLRVVDISVVDGIIHVIPAETGETGDIDEDRSYG